MSKKTKTIIMVAAVLLLASTTVFAFGNKETTTATAGTSAPATIKTVRTIDDLVKEYQAGKAPNWAETRSGFSYDSSRSTTGPTRITRFAPDWVKIEVINPKSGDFTVYDMQIEGVKFEGTGYVYFYGKEENCSFRTLDGTSLTYIETF